MRAKPRVLVPLAEGCEEIEAVTSIDLLRRAGIEVVTAGLAEGPVTASRGVVLVPDTVLDRALEDGGFSGSGGSNGYDMLVLPGGGPGADRLDRDPRIRTLVREMIAAGKHVAAICAAPKVLVSAGVLEGRRATSFPGILEEAGFPATALSTDPVVVDDKVVTSRGPGTAMDFALRLIEILAGRTRRDEVEAQLQRPSA